MSVGKIVALILLAPAVVFGYVVLLGYDPSPTQVLATLVMAAVGGATLAVVVDKGL